MTTSTDPASEERIEEMLEIEHDLREQYEDAQINTDDPEDEDDAPADSRLNEYTGRVIDFEREELSEHVKQTRAGSKIRLTILRHDGTKLTTPIQWPFDPTDKEEPLVRLCEYVGVPIDRVAELQGEYVPMEKNFGGHSHLEIPPIQTRGNRAVYWCRRMARKYNIPQARITARGVAGSVALMITLISTYQFAQIPDHPTTAGGFLLLTGTLFGMASILLLIPTLSTMIGYLYRVSCSVFRRFFPKAD